LFEQKDLVNLTNHLFVSLLFNSFITSCFSQGPGTSLNFAQPLPWKRQGSTVWPLLMSL